MNMSPDGRKLLTGFVAGLLLALAAMGGMYAIAATAATALASGFAMPAPSVHVRISDIATAVNHADDELQAARAACKRYTAGKRRNCNAAAEARQQEAVAEARRQ